VGKLNVLTEKFLSVRLPTQNMALPWLIEYMNLPAVFVFIAGSGCKEQRIGSNRRMGRLGYEVRTSPVVPASAVVTILLVNIRLLDTFALQPLSPSNILTSQLVTLTVTRDIRNTIQYTLDNPVTVNPNRYMKNEKSCSQLNTFLKDTRQLGRQMSHLSRQTKLETVSSNLHYYVQKQVQLLSLLSMNKCIALL
jgi:hypothetical protein